MITLDSKIQAIPRIGDALAKRLNKLDIKTVRDLLFYFPYRYDDYSEIKRIKDLYPGLRANIVGRIELIQNRRSPRKRMNITEALVSDETGQIRVVWFNQPYIAKMIEEGDQISLAGKIDEDYGGILMKSPAYEKVNPANINTQGLVPVYHLTENVTQKQLRYYLKSVMPLALAVEDWLPAKVIDECSLLPIGRALKLIHFPTSRADADTARKRLSFDELFFNQLQSAIIKSEVKSQSADPIAFHEQETKRFVDSLPFKLTDAQRKTSWAILQDMAEDKPMSRLLEGDVGSGKTLVAVIAALNTILSGKQAVIMVPTSILANQHFDTVCRLLKDFDFKIGLVTNADKRINYQLTISNFQAEDDNVKESNPSASSPRPELGTKAGRGKARKQSDKIDSQFIIQNSQLIIGTHALIQEKIKFENLGLAVVDEQHRFGVNQRASLVEKSGESGKSPHLLSMTATPIPRSLALVLFGELDISVINEMPKDRKKIITKVVSEDNREKAYEFIRQQIRNGRQAFVICPLIDFSDKLGVKSAKEEFEKLDRDVFPEIPMGILHGRMKAADKDEVMGKFLNNEIKIIVSTSVVEVGVDVPNASIMMIEGADRFGLAQLHQFRGRVGRGEYQSYCFLFSESQSEKTLNRLGAMVKYNDGLSLAKIDLETRGPGEVFGTAQKGFPEFKIASLFDYELANQAKKQAEELVRIDKTLTKWPGIRKKMEEIKVKSHLE